MEEGFELPPVTLKDATPINLHLSGGNNMLGVSTALALFACPGRKMNGCHASHENHK